MFKHCTKCDASWTLRDEFLGDPEIHFIGYQDGVRNQQSGYFLFNHSCQGTLAIPILFFSDLYDAPEKPYTHNHGSEEYCLINRGLMQCPSDCSCEFIYSVSEKINYWNKVTR